MLLVKLSKIAEAEGKTRRSVYNNYREVIVYIPAKGKGGFAAAVPLELLNPKMKKYAISIDDNDVKKSQNNCKKQGKGGVKVGVNDYLYLNNEKSIIKDKNKLYIDAQRGASIFGLADERFFRRRAERRGYEYIDVPTNGGIKKYYTVDSLPTDIQIKIFESIKSEQVERVVEGNKAFETAADKSRCRALERMECLKRWEDYRLAEKKKYKEKQVDQIDDEFCSLWNSEEHKVKISRSTLHRWEVKYKKSGIDGLVDAYSPDPRNVADFSDDAKDYVKAIYGKHPDMKIYVVYQKLIYNARLNNWLVPSYHTVRRYLLSLDKGEIAYLHGGFNALRNRAFPSLLSKGAKPGELAVGDAVWIRVSTGDGRAGERFCLFIWIDRGSGKVLSAIDADSANDVQAVLDGIYEMCLEHQHNHIRIDNGVDYREAGFHGKNAEIPYELASPAEKVYGAGHVHFSAVENAQAKYVERHFRDMHANCDVQFAGYTGAHIHKRPDAWEVRREDGAFLSRAETVKLVKIWIFEFYNNWAPNGHKSPNQVWADHFADANKMVSANPEYLRFILLRVWPKALVCGRHGVEFSHSDPGQKRQKSGIPARKTDRAKKRRFFWAPFMESIPAGGMKVFVKYHKNFPDVLWCYEAVQAAIGKYELRRALGEARVYGWQGGKLVSPIGENVVVGEHLSKLRKKAKEFEEEKKRLEEKFPVSTDADVMFGRGDVVAMPEENIDIETGEIIENKQEIHIDFQLEKGPTYEEMLKKQEELKQYIETLEKKIEKISTEKHRTRDVGEVFDEIERRLRAVQ